MLLDFLCIFESLRSRGSDRFTVHHFLLTTGRSTMFVSESQRTIGGIVIPGSRKSITICLKVLSNCIDYQVSSSPSLIVRNVSFSPLIFSYSGFRQGDLHILQALDQSAETQCLDKLRPGFSQPSQPDQLGFFQQSCTDFC